MLFRSPTAHARPLAAHPSAPTLPTHLHTLPPDMSSDLPPAKASRKTFYASPSLQPFSRSAAKRSSVMALGSIQYLQHQYTKLGIAGPAPLRPSGGVSSLVGSLVEEPEEVEVGDAGKKRPRKLKMGMVGRLLVEEEELPPSPAKPEVEIGRAHV